MIERIFSHPQGKIPYLEGGDGPNLFFLHGAFAMPHAYEPLLTLLAGSFHVIAPTNPGHGRSFHISSLWSYDDYIQTYVQFIASLHESPSILLGHSFGGALSFSLATHIPRAKVIAIDTAGLPYPLVVKDYLAALFREGEDAIKNNPNMQTIRELSNAARALAVTFKEHPENIPWFYRYASTLDLTTTLTSLTNPVGLLWGENDKVVPMSVGVKMKALIARSILKTYPGLEHNYVITRPKFTYNEILETISLISPT